MKNRSMALLFLAVIVIAIIFAVTEIMSASGAFLLITLMAIVMSAIWLERVRYEKHCLAQKLRLEQFL